MRLPLLTLGLLCICAAPLSASKPRHRTAAAHTHSAHTAARHTATHGRTSSVHSRTSARTASKPALAGMDSERATQIQSALIRSGYLSGEPSGTWDAQSAAAMQKLQSDNGWQTKVVPDSRALIKLGLGHSPQ